MRNIFGLAAGVLVCVGFATSGPVVMAREAEPPVFGAPAGASPGVSSTAQLNAPPDDSQREDEQQAGSGGQSGDGPRTMQSTQDPQQYAQQFAQPAQQAEQAEQPEQGQA